MGDSTSHRMRRVKLYTTSRRIRHAHCYDARFDDFKPELEN